jgi:hypothetical protein
MLGHRGRCFRKPRIIDGDNLVDWPVATVLLGTLGTLAAAILKWAPRTSASSAESRGGSEDVAGANGRIFARATDMAEIRARLVALEQAHVMRAELRSDMKELNETIRQSISGR